MRHHLQTSSSSLPGTPQPLRRLLVASAAVALLTMAGCGGDSPASTPKGSAASVSEPAAANSTPASAEPDGADDVDDGDPCRLITPAEAEVVLGTPVMTGEASSSDTPGYGEGFSCSYSAVDQSSGPTTARVSVLGSGFPPAEWEQAQRSDGMTAVEGVGDVAFVDEYNGSMDVLVDGSWLQAQLINVDEATLVSELTEICARAIERL